MECFLLSIIISSLFLVTHARNLALLIQLESYSEKCVQPCNTSIRFCLDDSSGQFSNSCPFGEFNILHSGGIGVTDSGGSIEADPFSFQVPVGLYRLRIDILDRDVRFMNGNIDVTTVGFVSPSLSHSSSINNIMLSYTYRVQATNTTMRMEGLSGGGIAGVVIAVLVVILLVVGAAVTGILLWKYQPWNSNVTNENRANVLDNPVYEVDALKKTASGIPKTNVSNHEKSTEESSRSAHSSQSSHEITNQNPLGHKNTDGDTREQSVFVENQALVQALQLDIAQDVEISGNSSASNIHSPTSILDPYASYKDNSFPIGVGSPPQSPITDEDDHDYEPVESIDELDSVEPSEKKDEAVFDDPDYEFMQ